MPSQFSHHAKRIIFVTQMAFLASSTLNAQTINPAPRQETGVKDIDSSDYRNETLTFGGPGSVGSPMEWGPSPDPSYRARGSLNFDSPQQPVDEDNTTIIDRRRSDEANGVNSGGRSGGYYTPPSVEVGGSYQPYTYQPPKFPKSIASQPPIGVQAAPTVPSVGSYGGIPVIGNSGSSMSNTEGISE